MKVLKAGDCVNKIYIQGGWPINCGARIVWWTLCIIHTLHGQCVNIAIIYKNKEWVNWTWKVQTNVVHLETCEMYVHDLWISKLQHVGCNWNKQWFAWGGVYKCKDQKLFVAYCCSFDSPTKFHAQILHDILLKALQASEVVQIRPCVADKTLDVWYTIFPDSRVSFSHFSVGAHCMTVLVSQLSCMVLRQNDCDHVRTGVFLTFRCATNSPSCFRLRQRLLKVHFPNTLLKW